MSPYRYTTPHGVEVTRTVSKAAFRKGLRHLLRDLDRHRGIYLSSGYEYPGRYSRWDIASTRPPLEIVAHDRNVELRPLNARGRALAQILHPVLAEHPHWEEFGFAGAVLQGRLKPLPRLFAEEERSKQPSAFSILRALMEEFRGEEDGRLGLVGAFGYDLLFQFPVRQQNSVPALQVAHGRLQLGLGNHIHDAGAGNRQRRGIPGRSGISRLGKGEQQTNTNNPVQTQLLHHLFRRDHDLRFTARDQAWRPPPRHRGTAAADGVCRDCRRRPVGHPL